jgi:hypothetical protein
MKPKYWFRDDEGKIYFLDFLNQENNSFREISKIKKVVKKDKENGKRITN